MSLDVSEDDDPSDRNIQEEVIFIFAALLVHLAQNYSELYVTAQTRIIALIKTLTMSSYGRDVMGKADMGFNPRSIFTTNEELALLLWPSDPLLSRQYDLQTDNHNPMMSTELSHLLKMRNTIDSVSKLSTLDDVNLFANIISDLHQEHLLRRHRRTLFITQKGHLGLGLLSVKLGCHVARFRGGHVFYVLESDDEC